jgi:hypothetical protein
MLILLQVFEIVIKEELRQFSYVFVVLSMR